MYRYVTKFSCVVRQVLESSITAPFLISNGTLDGAILEIRVLGVCMCHRKALFHCTILWVPTFYFRATSLRTDLRSSHLRTVSFRHLDAAMWLLF